MKEALTKLIKNPIFNWISFLAVYFMLLTGVIVGFIEKGWVKFGICLFFFIFMNVIAFFGSKIEEEIISRS